MAGVTLGNNGLAKISGTLTVYNYDSQTGEFTGATDEYLPQGVGIPDSACIDMPPDVAAGFVVIREAGCWQQLADHRGEIVYSTTDGSPVPVTVPGDYPAGTTTQKPATAFDRWGGERWVTDDKAQNAAAIAAANTEKENRISEANSITQAWQTQLLLGIITAADKASLTAWMKYVQAVQSLDTAIVQDITWPEKPVS